MKDFLLVDFEFTTYTKPVGRPRGFFSEIIEIGAVKLTGAELKEDGKIQNFVKPHFYPKQAKDSMDFCMITEKDMKKLLSAVRKFYEAFATAWEKENKPFGFEVQDHRMGGLEARLKAVQKKLIEYADGKTDSIPELDEKHLPCGFWSDGKVDNTIINNWGANISVGIV